ncbi:MAG: protein kinase [Alphaproteobacteria bacterium]|nr:protein kinase [Alphaproteobacteria bacterium]
MSTHLLELCELLDDDGTAAVFLARRRGSAGVERCVAVKLLTDAHAHNRSYLQEQAERMERHAHRSVARVEELTELRGRPAMVMEYIHGLDLARLMDARRRSGQPEGLPLAHAVFIVSRVAATLAPRPAECALPMHGELRPGRVMISDAGEVKVLAFGAHRACKGISMVPLPRDLYQPLRRSADGVKDDVFALGMILYSLCAGREGLTHPEWQEDPEAMLRAGLSPLRASPKAPRDLPQLIFEMCARHPHQRPGPLEVLERCEDMLEAMHPEPPFREWAREWVLRERGVCPTPAGLRALAEEALTRWSPPLSSGAPRRARASEPGHKLSTVDAAVLSAAATIGLGLSLVILLAGPLSEDTLAVREPAPTAALDESETARRATPRATTRHELGEGGKEEATGRRLQGGGPPSPPPGGRATPPPLEHPAAAERTDEGQLDPEPDTSSAPRFDPWRAGPLVTRQQWGRFVATRPLAERERVLREGWADESYMMNFDGPTPSPGSEDEPITGVPPGLAVSYCAGRGGLPYTDAEPLSWDPGDRLAWELRRHPPGEAERAGVAFVWRPWHGADTLDAHPRQTDTFSGFACAAPVHAEDAGSPPLAARDDT